MKAAWIILFVLVVALIAFVSCSTDNVTTNSSDETSSINFQPQNVQATPTPITSPVNPIPTDELTVAAVTMELEPQTGGDSSVYHWMVGAGILCDADSTACPVVSAADNDDRLSITGEGTVSWFPHMLTGGGTFLHTNAHGDTLGIGSWTATQLLNFHNYGAFDVQFTPAGSHGGRLMARVHLTANNGFERDALIRITRANGDQVPAGQHDGVWLNVPGIDFFNQPISGAAVFVLQE